MPLSRAIQQKDPRLCMVAAIADSSLSEENRYAATFVVGELMGEFPNIVKAYEGNHLSKESALDAAIGHTRVRLGGILQDFQADDGLKLKAMMAFDDYTKNLKQGRQVG